MDRDQFEQFLAEHADDLSDLDNVDDERLNAAHDGFASRLEELRARKDDRSLTDDELTELQEKVVPNLTAVRGQRQARDQRRTEAYAGLDDAFAQLDNEGGEEQDPNEQELEKPGDNEPTEDDAESETPEQVQEQAVAASAKKTGKATAKTSTKPRVPEIGTTGRNNGDGKPAGIQAGVTLTAACHQRERSRGDNMGFTDIGAALTDRLRGLRNGGGDGSQDAVVTFRASGVPDARYLKRGAPGDNTNKLDAVTSRPALVAAGGLCAPLAIDYTYQTIGVQGRPVRDSLPGFQADRGGIMFRPDVSPITDTDANGPKKATGIWTNDNDEHAYDTSNAPRKAVWIVDCPDVDTAEVEAITLQTEWSNVTSRFDPETVQANQAAALIWHDRFAENHLLDQLKALSKPMTSARALGATADVLVTLDRAQSYFRSVHRLGTNVSLRAIMPFWVRDLIRADMARRMTLDPMAGLNITDQQIDGILATRGLSPVWHLDGNSAIDQMGTTSTGQTGDDVPAQQYTLATAGSEIPKHPAKIDILMHAEGCFTHLDGGTLDLGIVRDSALIDRNRYRQFSETWEGVAKRGVEALRLISAVWPTGETSGATATDLSTK